MDIVAINDPFIDLDYMIYMIKYDTVHGRFPGTLEAGDGKLVVNGKAITVYNEMDPANPASSWGQSGADLHSRVHEMFSPPPRRPPPTSRAARRKGRHFRAFG